MLQRSGIADAVLANTVSLHRDTTEVHRAGPEVIRAILVPAIWGAIAGAIALLVQSARGVKH